MSKLCRVAAFARRSFHDSGRAGAKRPALWQSAPAARARLMRASAEAWKSGRPQVAAAGGGAPAAAVAAPGCRGAAVVAFDGTARGAPVATGTSAAHAI